MKPEEIITKLVSNPTTNPINLQMGKDSVEIPGKCCRHPISATAESMARIQDTLKTHAFLKFEDPDAEESSESSGTDSGDSGTESEEKDTDSEDSDTNSAESSTDSENSGTESEDDGNGTDNPEEKKTASRRGTGNSRKATTAK